MINWTLLSLDHDYSEGQIISKQKLSCLEKPTKLQIRIRERDEMRNAPW